MHDIIKDDSLSKAERKTLVLECDALLGLGLSDDPEEGLAALGHVAYNTLPEHIQDMITQREGARVAQNWQEADNLRDALKLAGYEITDAPEGTQVTKIEQ